MWFTERVACCFLRLEALHAKAASALAAQLPGLLFAALDGFPLAGGLTPVRPAPLALVGSDALVTKHLIAAPGNA